MNNSIRGSQNSRLKMIHKMKFILTLLSFSPSLCGNRVLRESKPALMLCIRRRSLLLAISRLIRFSCSIADLGETGRPLSLEQKDKEIKTKLTF